MKENSMKTTNGGPWGEEANTGLKDRNLSFEDSFTDGLPPTYEEKTYVPLEDSQQYLDGLEKKLARVQGKTLSQRETERKKLIEALSKSREDHAINFLNSVVESDLEESELDSENLNNGLASMNAVDPQGALGVVMRKCAPNHVALSAEELCELLKADIVAKVHEELHTEDNLPGLEEEEPGTDTLLEEPRGHTQTSDSNTQ